MMDCQYVATQRGGVALVFEGHRYNKVRDGKDGTVYWRCSRDRQCPGRAVTVHSRIKKANNKHNHCPDNGILSTKPFLNNNSLINNNSTSGLMKNSSIENAFENVAAAAALIRNSNHANQLMNQKNSSNYFDSSSNFKQVNSNLTEAAISLLNQSKNSNNSAAAAAVAALIQQQQSIFKPNCKIPNQVNSQFDLNKSNNFYKNDKITTDSFSIINNNDTLNKEIQQFRDNLLSTGSTNYLSNASSSSTSSSPLTSLCNGSINKTSFQNLNSSINVSSNLSSLSNNQNLNTNQNFDNSSKQNSFHNSFSLQNNLDWNNLNLLNSNENPTNSALNFHYTNKLSNKNSDFLKMNNEIQNLNNSIADTTNKSINKNNCLPNLNKISSLPNALSYFNNMNSLNNSIIKQDQQDWLTKFSNQINNNQINQIFAELEIKRLAQNSEILNNSNAHLPLFNNFSNEDFKMKEKIKFENDDKIKIQESLVKENEDQFKKKLTKNDSCFKDNLDLEKKNDLTHEKMNEKTVLKKSNKSKFKKFLEDEKDFKEEETIKIFKKDEINSPDSTSAININKLNKFLSNPSLILNTLNQFSLTNPQMASAFAASLLGQLDNNENLNENKLDDKSKYKNIEEQSYKKLKTDEIDYLSDSSEEDQPLNMALRVNNQIIRKFRQLMKNLNHVPEPLQAYIIPSCDVHQSEYISESDERRKFLSGFTGSAGTAIVTLEECLLWTDGRYHDQAEKELKDGWRLMKDGDKNTQTQTEFLMKNLPSGSKIGVDAKLYQYSLYNSMNETLSSNGIQLVPFMNNLVDLLWTDKPNRPSQLITPLELKYTGSTWQEKISKMREEMQAKESSILVISALDETAWLFNLRGSDIPFNPVFYAYTIITLDNVYLFVDEDQLSSSARKHLNLESSKNNKQEEFINNSPLEKSQDEVKVQIKPYESIYESLKELINIHDGKVWISSKSSYALVSIVPKNRQIDSLNPVLLEKAVKNTVEINCMRNAHIKDAVALCEFFAWLEEEIPKGNQTEISAAKKLLELRKEQENFVQNSFETISSSGPNGAIIHYKPTESSDRSLNVEEMYLCDSGAQYLDGTTDVTRTLHFGTPSENEKQFFTRVVKGHINLANCIFPEGAKGHQIDVLARKALWEVGLDYLHGTGHGVGCYLNVHEGPVSISPSTSSSGLKEGMILSNEPGYYEKDKFGIRIESLVVVSKKKTQFNFNNKNYLCFDTITLVPIQTKLLDPSLLTEDEMDWLDNYHQKCREVVGKALKEQGKTAGYKWLLKETQPLG